RARARIARRAPRPTVPRPSSSNARGARRAATHHRLSTAKPRRRPYCSTPADRRTIAEHTTRGESVEDFQEQEYEFLRRLEEEKIGRRRLVKRGPAGAAGPTGIA